MFWYIQYYTYICRMKNDVYIDMYDCYVAKSGNITQYGKVKKPYLSNGYKVVKLNTEKGFRNIAVHRLVAMAFIPNLENKPCIDHIDGNKTNNRIDNLRWCTVGENLRFENVKRNPRKYPVKRIDKDGNVVEFDNVLDACFFPWQKYMILQVCNGKRKTYDGYKWEHNDPADSGNK